ncbi:hypothetical protein LK533_01250 [Sphingomonas sp. PL-96]|uniref:hypothetical protein n=1 Tax=Sphingomonas sp. PL-96 TaxID=2887201 RepID=UPI001E355959|nr:hypothetical protein [Sphingomonas sp. PL-96]MCC2975297.1 hypothetical protein [Sphingomonas sp. PL-96]
MAAFGFKTLGWCLCVAVVAPAFYLVTSQVAAERSRVESVERAIVKARADIRVLETEFDTRANLAQLERWNGDVLSLAAPRAEQFVGGEAMLAQLPGRKPGEDVQFASYVVPSAPVVLTAAAMAKAEADAAAAKAVAAEAVTARAPVATASAAPAAAAPRKPTAAAPVAVASKAPAPRKPMAAPVRTADATTVKARPTRPAERKAQAVAMLDQTLLSDRTLRDLARGARSEAVKNR